MASAYPGGLDNQSTAHVDNVDEIIHASTVNDLADAVNKIETELGTLPKGSSADVKTRLTNVQPLTGATAATRYVGGTTSGAPVSGTFALGDYIVTQDGHIYICTVAGTPGTWTQVAGGAATSPLTTKGDIWGFSTVDARIPIGSNGQVLTADSTQSLGVKWATDVGSGDESLNTIASSGAAQTINVANGATQDITLTANCTLTFTSPASGSAWYMTLLLRQDATGSRTVTWPTITWLGSGIAPILQTAANSVDSVVVFTVDGGSHWFGVAQTSASGLKSGTAFPGSPSDGDLFYRTDRRILYEYNATATQWLSLDRKYVTLTGTRVLMGTANVTGIIGGIPIFEDVYVESWATVVRTGGTNNGSNFSTVALMKEGPAQALTTVSSFTTASDATASAIVHNISVATVIAAASFPELIVNVTATGSPTTSDIRSELILRSVG